MGKTYINQCLRQSKEIGAGATLLGHSSFHPLEEDLPILTACALEARNDIRFPELTERIGFYPIVDRAKWIDELAPAGVKTMQIRIKDLTGPALIKELELSVSVARRNDICLFVNDYWQEAIEIGAFGVHLGQDDLQKADLDALRHAGLRIGISTHCWSEVARALSIRPSYIAVGPIFPTTVKQMPFAPQGLSGFSLWRRLLSSPLVAIGGISLESGSLIAGLGADGIAVISDICNAESPAQRASQWVQMINGYRAHGPRKSELFCKCCQTSVNIANYSCK
jgi:hydroxymethylpyrimidine kinase/phosphomethylpyrimidine kinase/thiamine-phosphate diphosphorylase